MQSLYKTMLTYIYFEWNGEAHFFFKLSQLVHGGATGLLSIGVNFFKWCPTPYWLCESASLALLLICNIFVGCFVMEPCGVSVLTCLIGDSCGNWLCLFSLLSTILCAEGCWSLTDVHILWDSGCLRTVKGIDVFNGDFWTDRGGSGVQLWSQCNWVCDSSVTGPDIKKTLMSLNVVIIVLHSFGSYYEDAGLQLHTTELSAEANTLKACILINTYFVVDL